VPVSSVGLLNFWEKAVVFAGNIKIKNRKHKNKNRGLMTDA